VELTGALVVFLAVAGWRFARWRRSTPSEPFPDVGSAPTSAKPVSEWRYNTDGLGMNLRPRAEQPASEDGHRIE
jgi:hypothetical protein